MSALKIRKGDRAAYRAKVARRLGASARAVPHVAPRRAGDGLPADHRSRAVTVDTAFAWAGAVR